MLLLEDRRFYVYVYLNPLKLGTFIYNEFCFAYEPFYVGKGKNNRIFYHIKEAERSMKNNTIKGNMHKIYTINKIKNEFGCDPITLKIKSNLTAFEACELEKYLINIIGRNDLNIGPLTNQTDGGEGCLNTSEELKQKISNSHKRTLKNRPELIEASIMNLKNYYANRTENQKFQTYQRLIKTLKENPDIKINSTKKRIKTEEERGSRKRATEKCKQTKLNDPSINIEGGKKLSQYWKDHPEEQKSRDKKNSETRINRKIAVGINNNRYIKIDHIFVINSFFIGKGIKDIMNEYDSLNKEMLTCSKIRNIFEILNFPVRVKNHGFYTKKYLQFISENKDKQQWYIDNYKRLEQEYFDRKFAERHPEFIEEKIS